MMRAPWPQVATRRTLAPAPPAPRHRWMPPPARHAREGAADQADQADTAAVMPDAIQAPTVPSWLRLARAFGIGRAPRSWSGPASVHRIQAREDDERG
ncbi:hypothetical protein C6568_17405 [Melaminivora suipulveris]|uniref:Uncharacterized protein n=1 Tax=Melaminivora suipulveris TaxID=2109913 RepID=A0A2R3QGD0_9BURK|nr:hypothetical protein [Melaminivora suipulveris]AVO50802.1 hypothetical protein C6568_17405 [Melaminivora suipulveris]